MLTWLLAVALPGSLIFGGLAYFWRRRAGPAHLAVVLPLALLAWLASMLFGWFVYLDVMQAGPMGPGGLRASVLWALAPAILAFWVLRRPA